MDIMSTRVISSIFFRKSFISEEELKDKIIIRKEGNNKFIILETQKEKNA